MPRLRELGITIGQYPTGPHNTITDVPELTVGHSTIIQDEPMLARSGVTVVLPRGETSWQDAAFASYFSFNGCGEMTGLAWLDDFGTITSPIAITNTHSVGAVHDALLHYAVEHRHPTGMLPIVAETYDGWLNGYAAFHVQQQHVYDAIERASNSPVDEGNVGGGTGMICHEFKGGIGTASRIISAADTKYTVGVLVQTNYGTRAQLRVDGIPVGRLISADHTPLPWPSHDVLSSIIVIIATNAPLLPGICRRLAKRATTGLSRVGGIGQNGSGDIFLAFSTGNHLPVDTDDFYDLKLLSLKHINPFFEAVAEATEEAILNALTAADTMIGFNGRTAHALPTDQLVEIMKKHGVSLRL